MFDERGLADAVEIQERSYRLLLWVAEGIKRGFLPFRRAHEYSSRTDAAREWLADNYLNLPLDSRPPQRSGPELERFARFFASYLRASFNLEPQPRAQLISVCGCYCDWCADLVAASHLKTKKLTTADKRRAEKLMLAYLQALARDQAVGLPEGIFEQLLAHPDGSRALGLATYGRDLLARVQGQGLPGPATLALWRAFAWAPSGSPIPKFKLRAADIIEAENQLAELLRTRSAE